MLALAPRGAAIELVDMVSTAWASATFLGARHTIRLSAADDDGLVAWLTRLPDAQFRLAGHLLVEIVVAAVERAGGTAAVVLEALTVEEA